MMFTIYAAKESRNWNKLIIALQENSMAVLKLLSI